MTLLNWLFVPVAFAFGIGTAFFVCMNLLTIGDSIASAFMVMDGKTSPSSLNTVLASMTLCIGCIIGAATTVLLPAFSAPKYKKETAHLALVLGAVISGVLLSQTGWAIFIPAYLSALGAGVASVAYAGKVLQLQPNISLGVDTQQQDAASRRLPHAGQL